MTGPPLTREQLAATLSGQAATYGAQGAAAGSTFLQGAQSFDASQGLNRFAQGAWGSISQALNKRLQQLHGQSVGAGRFDTGYFDQDQGTVVRGALDDFSSRVSQEAVVAQGQQLENQRELEQYGESASDRSSALYGDMYTNAENDYRSEQAYQRSKKRGIGSAIGGVLGAGAGAFFGGPAGAGVGYAAGSGIGGMFG